MLAIRTASLWYQKHLLGGPNILLLTNDVENKKRALQEGIRTETGKFVKFMDMLFSLSNFWKNHITWPRHSVQSFVKSLGKPELLDLVVQTDNDNNTTHMDVEELRPSKKKLIYEEVSLG